MARARKSAKKASKPSKPKVLPKRKVKCSFCGRTKRHVGVDDVLWKWTIFGEDRTTAICSLCVYAAMNFLNEKLEEYRRDVYIGSSKIHGQGLFAGERIKKGEYVGTYVGPDDAEETDTNFPYIIWVYDAKGEIVESRLGVNEFRFLNHAKKANLRMEDWHFYATRNIKKGEELTWFYSEDFDDGVKKTAERKTKGKAKGKVRRRK